MFSFVNKAKVLLATGLAGLLAIPVVVVPGETISLWDFNEASGGTVADSVTTDAKDGTASANVQIVSGSVMGSGFGSARDFSVAGSYVDLGEIASSKLDLVNKNEVAIEAMIYLTADVSTPVTIFDNRQIQLQVIENRLAAFVRQSSGFKGVVAQSTLAKNIPYRVGAHFKNGYMIVTVENKVVGSVKIAEAIQSAELGAIARIGGDISSENFPGIIDDVRLSNVATLDTIPPEISLLGPDISVPTVNASPTFSFEITDNENEIDLTSFVFRLNGNVVTGMTYNSTTKVLSGQLSSPLLSGKKNYVDVSVKDKVGNPSFAQYEIKYINWGSGEEYASDSDTLGLWHLNDNGMNFAKDSSAFNRHGKYKGTHAVPGVLGQARNFYSPYQTDEITLPPVPIPGSTFTFEAWVRPLNDGIQVVDIFNNEQISIQRTDSGSVRVNLKSYYETHTYDSSAGVFPAAKWSHVKVVYDGARESENLLILIDGLIVNQFDAVQECEFDEEPKIAHIGGNNFKGDIDEVRLSKIVRESTNIIRGNPPTVELASPLEEATVRSSVGTIYAKISDADGVNTGNVEVKLNGVVQSGAGLTVTSSEISGTLPSALKLGLNEIEIRVKGLSGNQTVLQRRFYYIKDGGLVEYVNDASTAGLWHFNEDGGPSSADASGNNHPMAVGYGEISVDEGKFGNGVRHAGNGYEAQGIKFSGKSFTVEGWVKPPEDASNTVELMWYINGTYFNANVGAGGKALSVALSVPGSNGFSTQLPEVLTTGRYNHVAIIMDGESDSSNFMVLVDGKVVYSRNLKAYCNSCISSLSFGIHRNQYSYDEVRVSNVPRYTLNVGSGEGPAIGLLQTLPLATVHTSQPTFKVHYSDLNSIDPNSMSLAVNGVVDSTLSKTVSGSTGTLTGQTSVALMNGANEITVRGKNQLGQESVKTFYVFYITPGSPTAYSATPSTMGLWHFNIGDGANDSSDRAFHLNGIPTDYSNIGVFDESLYIPNSGFNAYASPAPQTQSWTFETWVKTNGNSSYYTGIDGRNTLSINGEGVVTYGFGESRETSSGVIPSDDKFHHVAVIADAGNPHRNALLVVDGKVVHSFRKGELPMMEFGSMDGGWNGVYVDEARLSSEAVYSLSFQKPNGNLFKAAKKMFRKK